jgi:hypothetical protein
MRERVVSVADLEAVIGAPTVTVRRADGCVEYTGTARGRRLKAILDVTVEPRILVTVYWPGKEQRR